MTERWLSVEVFRCAAWGDCSKGGVTSREMSLYVPCETGNHENPPEALRLVLGTKGGKDHFVPVELANSGRWTSFGGNFVWTSDGRFRQKYGDRPLSVHDRVESADQGGG